MSLDGTVSACSGNTPNRVTSLVNPPFDLSPRGSSAPRRLDPGMSQQMTTDAGGVGRPLFAGHVHRHAGMGAGCLIPRTLWPLRALCSAKGRVVCWRSRQRCGCGLRNLVGVFLACAR